MEITSGFGMRAHSCGPPELAASSARSPSRRGPLVYLLCNRLTSGFTQTNDAYAPEGAPVAGPRAAKVIRKAEWLRKRAFRRWIGMLEIDLT